MKTISKIKLDSGRIIKNEELILLKGGYYTYDCCMFGGTYCFAMSSVQDNEFAASIECTEFYAGYGGGQCFCLFAS
jgi:natural product precursor